MTGNWTNFPLSLRLCRTDQRADNYRTLLFANHCYLVNPSSVSLDILFLKMASQTELKRRLQVLMKKPENMLCCDCPERQPRWASLIVPPPGSPPGSLPIGAFMCLECSGSHRRLGVHIAFVRSVNLDQCTWVVVMVVSESDWVIIFYNTLACFLVCISSPYREGKGSPCHGKWRKCQS